MAQLSIFTIGYEDRTVNEFISRLQRHNISLLVDVREMPASRKRGFSKSQLMKALSTVDIQYLHVKALGSPKALRDKLHEDNDYESFFAQYRCYIETQIETVKSLYWKEISRRTSCLMCMERLPELCHRKDQRDRWQRSQSHSYLSGGKLDF